jgi:transcriptional regulator with XRE-family HTH domain
MISLLTPAKAQQQLAANLQARRVALGLTQAGLSIRSGVALGTLRKFERTGAASMEALLKLMAVLGGLEALVAATAPEPAAFTSIDEVLRADAAPKRKYGWRS